ncbi:MAG: hypothetical protein HYY18_04930 [Planctomycetes bacterium]|nr:hypothetical protein [Planctomycetota bacterium]
MTKGIAMGVVIGALLAAGLFRFVESRRGGGDGGEKKPPGASAGAASISPEAEALRKEIAALGEEGTKLLADLKAADERVAAAKGGAGKPVAKKSSRNPWADIGPKMYKLRAKLDNNEGGMDPEVQELFVELIDIMKKLSEEYGMGMEEFQISPWGLPMILLAMLDGSEAKPDAEQAGRYEKLMDDAEADWKALMARKEELTELERQRELFRMTSAEMDAIRSSLTPEQRAIMEQVKFLNRENRFPARYYSGTRESVAGTILLDWKEGLKLDDASETALRPVVDDYLRSYQAMEDDFKRREAAGQKVSSTERAMAQADLMIAAQKRVTETVRLSEEQMKALREWDHAINVTIDDGSGAAIPPDD